jgi:hypothetical protein
VIIQSLLIAGLLGTFGYAMSQRRRSWPLSVVMMALAACGVVFVLVPDVTNSIASAVGVGRGADLILYCFVLIMLVAVFNIHLRIRSSLDTTTELARAIALLSARSPDVPQRAVPVEAGR